MNKRLGTWVRDQIKLLGGWTANAVLVKLKNKEQKNISERERERERKVAAAAAFAAVSFAAVALLPWLCCRGLLPQLAAARKELKTNGNETKRKRKIQGEQWR